TAPVALPGAALPTERLSPNGNVIPLGSGAPQHMQEYRNASVGHFSLATDRFDGTTSTLTSYVFALRRLWRARLPNSFKHLHLVPGFGAEPILATFCSFLQSRSVAVALSLQVHLRHLRATASNARRLWFVTAVLAAALRCPPSLTNANGSRNPGE